MTRDGFRKRVTAGVVAALAGGSVYLSLPSCQSVVRTVNPCGTVFGFCDANDVDLLFTDIPDFGLDPTCTIPFLTGCSAGNVFPRGNGNVPRP